MASSSQAYTAHRRCLLIRLNGWRNWFAGLQVEGGLGNPYAFDVPNWDVGFQATFSCNRNDVGSGFHTEFGNSISIGHAVVGKLSCLVEFFSGVSTQRNYDWTGTVDTWLTYQVNKNLFLWFKRGGEVIASFGQAQLDRYLDGKCELRRGSKEDPLAAKEGISQFWPELVVREV